MKILIRRRTDTWEIRVVVFLQQKLSLSLQPRHNGAIPRSRARERHSIPQYLSIPVITQSEQMESCMSTDPRCSISIVVSGVLLDLQAGTSSTSNFPTLTELKLFPEKEAWESFHFTWLPCVFNHLGL